MRLIVNGEPRETTAPTLAALLTELGVKGTAVACEVNLRVVRRDAFDRTTLTAGDRVEIVHVIGGGS